MSIGKLLLKIRQHVHTPFNTAIIIILIIFGMICSSTGDIAPNEDSTAEANGHTKADLGINSILNDNNNNLEMPHPGDKESTKGPSNIITDLGFIHAFVASISVILVSELGDKTFFIAAIMAMRHPRLTVFTGAIFALALMTILSAVFGMAATIIPRAYTYYISTALFAIFGLKMLKEGYYMSPTDAQEELEEVQSDLRKREDELMRATAKKNKLDEDEVPTSSDEDEHNTINSNNNNVNNKNNIDNSITSSSNLSPNSIIGDRKTKSTSNLLTKPNPNENSNNITSSTSTDEGIDVMGPSTATSVLGLNNTNDVNNIVTLNNGMTSNISSSKATAGGNMELIQVGGAKKRLERESATTAMVADPESGVVRKVPKRGAYYLATRIFMQAFTMTFLAEWGDRSQLTTIILGAREDVYGVIVGGVLGHSICTGLAVIGGRMIAQKISVRTVTLVGGVVFILFAISALFFDPNDT